MNDLFTHAKDLHAAGRAQEAERLYREVLASQPDHVEALHGLGVLCLQTQRLEPALKYLGKAVAVDPASATLLNNLGVALAAAGRFEEAADAYRRSLTIAPDAPGVHVNLAAALGAGGRTDEAIAQLQRAVRLQPDSLDLAMHLAVTALRAARFEAAEAAYRAALALQPDLAEAHCGQGEALGALDRHEEAARCFERAIALAPDVAMVHYNYGSALTFLGRLDEARTAYETAVGLAPEVPSYRYALMALKPIAADDPDLRALERMALSAANYPAWEQAELHIALAGAYDGLGRWEKAFSHFESGNAIKRRLVRYDEAEELRRLSDVAARFTREFLATHAGEGDPDPRPVFVVGMPRSGTSLVEQVLASHSAVFGAGEQSILPALAAAGPTEWRVLGAAYVERLQRLAPEAERIVDKLPGNFVHAGLIHLALPNARIIHVTRDPLDTCFSCYSKLFSGAVNYAYDLGELGRYYRAYAALIAHWRSVLPPTVLLDVSYEALVADLEPQARRLVAHCGLEWEPRCLAFHASKRAVRTASAVQVRRPLYNNAIGRARPYLPWLGALQAALAP